MIDVEQREVKKSKIVSKEDTDMHNTTNFKCMVKSMINIR